jgi:hypothetical protein
VAKKIVKYFPLTGALLVAVLLIVLHGWGIEETWIKPSLVPREEGAAGRAQWGGMIPEFRDPPRVYLDNDPYYWIRYAQTVARGETWRVRSTQLDNVPFGREVHWNSGWVWWLAGGGLLWSYAGGQSWHDGIESWALYAAPVLFVIVFSATGWWVARRRGAFAAVALVLTLAALPGVMWDFGYARPDHHGMHNTAALLLLLGFTLAGGGWIAGSKRHEVSQAEVAPARRAMIVAALGAAAGLWVGATQQIFVLAGAGAGLLLGLLWPARDATEALDPSLFRRWGTIGAATALALYALEYFPGHLGMRLEVNHPLYALALWGAGEMLAAVATWRATGRLPQGASRVRLGAAVVLLLLPLVALAAGPESWHVWRDGFMRRQHEFINEFEPFVNSLQQGPVLALLARFGLLPLLLPVGLALVFSPRLSPSLRAGLLCALGAATVTGAMVLVQVRWVGLFGVCLSVLLVAVLAGASSWLSGTRAAPWQQWLLSAFVAALVLPLFVFFAIGLSDNFKRRDAQILDPVLAWTIASRDLAFNLKRLQQLGPVRVMSGPGQTPALHFFGGVPGTAALYWENLDGVRDAAIFFADQGDAEARRIAAERGITHVVLQSDTTLAESSVRIALDSDDPELIKQSLAYRLADPAGDVPAWLEPVPYYGSPMAANFSMRVFRVRPDKLNVSGE